MCLTDVVFLAEAKTDNSNCQNCGIQRFGELRVLWCCRNALFVVICSVVSFRPMWGRIVTVRAGQDHANAHGELPVSQFPESLLSSITQALASSLIKPTCRCWQRYRQTGVLWSVSTLVNTGYQLSTLHLSPLYPELCCFPDDNRACQATLRDTVASQCIRVYTFGPNDC